jgi:hypothetical protein
LYPSHKFRTKENNQSKTPKQCLSKKIKEKPNEEFQELAQRNIFHATYSLYEKEVWTPNLLKLILFVTVDYLLIRDTMG